MAWRPFGWLAGGTLALLGAWHAAIAPLAPLARLEEASDDLQQAAIQPLRAGPAGPHPDILIVDIDERSLQAEGHWPWRRERLAALSHELLARQQVAALAFDFVFAEPAPGDAALAQAWQGMPVIAGFYLSARPALDGAALQSGQLPCSLPAAVGAAAPAGLPPWNGYAASVPVLAAAAPHAGFFNVLPDTDGLVRSVPAVARLADGQWQPSLVLATLATAAGLTEIQPLLAAAPAGEHAQTVLTGLRLQAAGQIAREVPLDEHGEWRVPFRGPTGVRGGSFRYLSASEVMAGALPAGSLKGQIVFVGSSAPGLGDLRPTPAGRATPGVEVHAHLLAGLLAGELPYRPSWAPGYEVCLILFTLLACAAVSQLAAPVAMASVAVLMLLLMAGHLALRMGAALVLPASSAVLLGTLLSALLIGRNYLHEWRSRRSLLLLFDQYLPPERARELARSTDQQPLEAANRELTLLFCDLQGFSALAEQLPPLALRDLLNHYFSTATRIVHAHGGTLDKFIGDAVMAFWGAPQPQADHAQRAVQAALTLLNAAGPLNAELQAQGLPPIRFGIGVATGVVCVGDLGSTLRRSYTAVGDAVNLAARLEALTRDVGVPLLVADTTRAACDDKLPGVAWLEVEQCQVRGRQQSVTVFTPATVAAPAIPRETAQLRTWALAQAAAQREDADQARALLAELDATLPAVHALTSFTLSSADSNATLANGDALSRTLGPLSRRLAQRLRTP